jgi:hypothetical protein
MTQITVEEFKRLQAAQRRRERRNADGFVDCLIAAIQNDNWEAVYNIGTCDAPFGAWHLFFHRISNGAVAEISPQIKETFQQVWLEKKSMALTVDNPRLLRRALRRLLPPYSGPAIQLYRGATLEGWRRGFSWTADIEIARLFFPKELLTIPGAATPVILKTLAPPEAIICKIEYPAPFTEEDKAETPEVHFVEFHDEQEYIATSCFHFSAFPNSTIFSYATTCPGMPSPSIAKLERYSRPCWGDSSPETTRALADAASCRSAGILSAIIGSLAKRDTKSVAIRRLPASGLARARQPTPPYSSLRPQMRERLAGVFVKPLRVSAQGFDFLGREDLRLKRSWRLRPVRLRVGHGSSFRFAVRRGMTIRPSSTRRQIALDVEGESS